MSNIKDIRLEEANGCHLYDPCPLCFNCMNKAAHLYARCASCVIPHDNHDYKKRALMIRRDNFAVTLTKESGEKVIKWIEEKSKKEEGD